MTPELAQAVAALQQAVTLLAQAMAAADVQPQERGAADGARLPLLLRPDEVAAVLDCDRSTVYQLLKRGELPATRLGASLRVSDDALLRWIAEHTDSPHPTAALAAHSRASYPAQRDSISEPVKLRQRRRVSLGGAR